MSMYSMSGSSGCETCIRIVKTIYILSCKQHDNWFSWFSPTRFFAVNAQMNWHNLNVSRYFELFLILGLGFLHNNAEDRICSGDC